MILLKEIALYERLQMEKHVHDVTQRGVINAARLAYVGHQKIAHFIHGQ